MVVTTPNVRTWNRGNATFISNNCRWIALRAEIPLTEIELQELEERENKNIKKTQNIELENEKTEAEDDWGADENQWTEETNVDLKELLANSKKKENEEERKLKEPNTEDKSKNERDNNKQIETINQNSKVLLIDEKEFYEYEECFTPYYIDIEVEPKASATSYKKEKKLLQEYKIIQGMQEQVIKEKK